MKRSITSPLALASTADLTAAVEEARDEVGALLPDRRLGKSDADAGGRRGGAGNGILTIANGTLPLALFGAAGYGRRIGWLNAPARILQAAAP